MIPLLGGSSTTSLVQATSGKLARYIAGDANDPFNTADWTGANATLSLDFTENDALAADITSGGEGGARHTAVADRSKQMVQAEVKSDVSNDGALQINAHFQDVNNKIDARWGIPGDNFRLSEWDGGSITNHQEAAKTVAPDTWYWGTVFVDGTTLCIVYDFGDNLRHEQTTGLTESTGRAGFGRRNSTGGDRDGWCRNFYQHADRFLTVTGLQTGDKAKVLDGTNSVLSEATESGGTAEVDMVEVRPDQSVHLIVTDSVDTELIRTTPSDGLWGGDEWTYTP